MSEPSPFPAAGATRYCPWPTCTWGCLCSHLGTPTTDRLQMHLDKAHAGQAPSVAPAVSQEGTP